MQSAKPHMGNGATRTAEELNVELAALRHEFEQVRQERDEYRNLVYAFVAKQGPVEVDDAEVLSHLGEHPTVRELIEEMTQQG
jgi:hypothetical protein